MTMTTTYGYSTKKYISEIEALQFGIDGGETSQQAIKDFCPRANVYTVGDFYIATPSGSRRLSPGDWVVKRPQPIEFNMPDEAVTISTFYVFSNLDFHNLFEDKNKKGTTQ